MVLFYFFAAFFPRLALLFGYLCAGLPYNTSPFWLDVLMALFCPRFLIAFWLYEAGGHPLAIGLFILLGVMEWLGNTIRIRSDS